MRRFNPAGAAGRVNIDSLSLASANWPSVRFVYRAVVFRFSCPRIWAKADQVVAVVGKVLVGHRVPQQMRVNLHADQGGVLIDHCPDAAIPKRPAFADEDIVRGNRGPRLQVRLDRTPGRERQRDRPLLPALAEAEDHRAAALANDQVGQFQGDEIADTSASVKEEMEDGVGPHVLTKLDLPQQPPHVAPFHSLGGELLPTQFLDRLGGVGWDMPFLDGPGEIPTQRDKAAVYGETACPCCRRSQSLKSVTSRVVTRLMQNGSALAWANHAANFRKS